MKTLNDYLKGLVCITAALLILNVPVLAYPPDPDNAALLYYQAFLLCGQPNDTVDQMLKEFIKGKIEANEQIAACVEKYQEAIGLATLASDIPNCDWGLKYSEGLSMQTTYLGHARILSRLMIADARILAESGDIKSAIEACIAVQKMGRHFGHTTYVSYLMGCAISKMSNTCIQQILPITSVDLETLNLLSIQLDYIDKMPFSNMACLEIEAAVMRTYINRQKAEELLQMEAISEQPLLTILTERIDAADEEFFRRNLAYWDNYIASIRSALRLPYLQAYPEIEKLSSQDDEAIKNPDATLTAILAPRSDKVYNIGVEGETYLNAIRTAVEIYKIKAETGRLPEDLPAGLPKDLFSGVDFGYQKTDDGFILACKSEDLSKNRIHQYEFKISR